MLSFGFEIKLQGMTLYLGFYLHHIYSLCNKKVIAFVLKNIENPFLRRKQPRKLDCKLPKELVHNISQYTCNNLYILMNCKTKCMLCQQ